MKIVTPMYNQIRDWERKRLPRNPVVRKLWTLVRYPYIVLGYGGVFACSIPVIFGLPFGLLKVMTAPASTWRWTIGGTMLLATAALLAWHLNVILQAWRANTIVLERSLFAAGLLCTINLQMLLLLGVL